MGDTVRAWYATALVPIVTFPQPIKKKRGKSYHSTGFDAIKPRGGVVQSPGARLLLDARVYHTASTAKVDGGGLHPATHLTEQKHHR